MDRETAQARLTKIQGILDAGVSTVTHNGRTVTYNLSQLAIERDRLLRYLNTGGKSGLLRKVVYNADAV